MNESRHLGLILCKHGSKEGDMRELFAREEVAGILRLNDEKKSINMETIKGYCHSIVVSILI